jgi:hypothetical protein
VSSYTDRSLQAGFGTPAESPCSTKQKGALSVSRAGTEQALSKRKGCCSMEQSNIEKVQLSFYHTRWWLSHLLCIAVLAAGVMAPMVASPVSAAALQQQTRGTPCPDGKLTMTMSPTQLYVLPGQQFSLTLQWNCAPFAFQPFRVWWGDGPDPSTSMCWVNCTSGSQTFRHSYQVDSDPNHPYTTIRTIIPEAAGYSAEQENNNATTVSIVKADGITSRLRIGRPGKTTPKNNRN